MQDAIKRQVDSVIQYRRQLAQAETKRAQYQQNVPTEIWQELAEAAHRLEQAEQKIRQICLDLASDVNHTRADIVTLLEQYNHWREQMRLVENEFLINIIRPGHHLKEAIHQREYLEREYQRIFSNIQYTGYASQQELETDIRRVLSYGDTAFDPQAEMPDEDLLQDEDLLAGHDKVTVEDLVEAISKEELIREFRRVVLPKVHPDTSNSPVEVFKSIYEVYKKGDFLLMEAYIVEYQGEVEPELEADPLESLDQILKTRQRYQRLSGRLQRRLERLKQDLTAQELENPEKISGNMQLQRQEILARVQVEAEQILYWREKIENLVKVYREQGHEASNPK